MPVGLPGIVGVLELVGVLAPGRLRGRRNRVGILGTGGTDGAGGTAGIVGTGGTDGMDGVLVSGPRRGVVHRGVVRRRVVLHRGVGVAHELVGAVGVAHGAVGVVVVGPAGSGMPLHEAVRVVHGLVGVLFAVGVYVPEVAGVLKCVFLGPELWVTSIKQNILSVTKVSMLRTSRIMLLTSMSPFVLNDSNERSSLTTRTRLTVKKTLVVVRIVQTTVSMALCTPTLRR